MRQSSAKTRDSRGIDRVRPLVSAPVEIQIMGAGTLEVLTAHDISVSGIGIMVPHRFLGCQLDHEVKLIITLPGIRPFWATGIVRHSSTDGADDLFGVEFTKMEPPDLARIMRYVEARMAADS